MIWSHSHHEKWATIRCGKPKQVCSALRKWAKHKQYVGVVGQVKPNAYLDVLSWYLKEGLLEVRQIPTRATNSPKKPTTRENTKPLGSQKVGPKSRQPKVTILGIS